MSSASPDWQNLGWENQAAQYRRFSVLDPLLQNGMKILDVGCGLGNLLDYLQVNGRELEFTGIDVLEEMVERALAKHPTGDFRHGDIFDENIAGAPASFDLVFASGVFNINLGNNEAFICRAVDRFLALSRRHVVFNLLHDRSQNKEEDKYFYSSPEAIVDMLQPFCPSCTLSVRDDYLPNDYSILISRSD